MEAKGEGLQGDLNAGLKRVIGGRLLPALNDAIHQKEGAHKKAAKR